MGFLDKLKGVVTNATSGIQKMKEEQAKQAAVDALERYGSIKGSGIPEKAEFCLDQANNRIVVRTGIINNHHNLIREYSCDDVTEVKLLACTQSEYSAYKSTYNNLKLTLISGEELEICQIISEYNEKKEFNVQREQRDKNHFIDITLAFMLKINDAPTKEWLNTLYELYGLLPAFDENGEFSAENMEANSAKF